MTYNPEDISGWIGHEVIDSSGDKIGKVSDIYVEDETDQPEWLTVATGLFGNRSSFVPLQGAVAEDDHIVVPFSKAQVKDAPQVDDDGDGHLTESEEDALYQHYRGNVTPSEPGSTGDAMTLSEERVNVGTRSEEIGRVRLRKYVVTEMVTQTVPVSHEEVRIEREPIEGGERSDAEFSEEEREVTLRQDRVVVEKETVPVEQVRLAKETVAGEETVSTDARHEEVEQEGFEGDESSRRA